MTSSLVIDHSASERCLHRAHYVVVYLRASLVLLAVMVPGTVLFLATGFEGALLPTSDIARKLNDLMKTPDAAGHIHDRTFYLAVAVLTAGLAVALMWSFVDAIRRVRRRTLKITAGVAAFTAIAYVAGRARDYVFAAQHLDPLYLALLALGMTYAVALTLDMALALWAVAGTPETASLNAIFERRLAAGRWSAVNKLLDLPRTPLRSPRALLAYALELLGAILITASFAVVLQMGGVDSRLDGLLAICRVDGLALCRAASAVQGREIALWVFLALLGMPAGGVMKSYAKSLGGLGVTDAIGSASGRFILYLRPFTVDRLELPKPRLPFFSRFLTVRPFPLRLEDELFDVADGFLPLVAIGNPRDNRRLRSGEAHREFLPDEAWQKVVGERLARAEHVVVVVENTDGVVWELTRIIDGGFAHKTLFLFDPSARDPVVWASLANLLLARLARAGLVPRGFTLKGKPLGLYFRDGEIVGIENTNWSATSFRTAFSYFLTQRSEGRRDASGWGRTQVWRYWKKKSVIPSEIPGHAAIKAIDIEPFARCIRLFWNVLRPAMLPWIAAWVSIPIALWVKTGEQSHLSETGPLLALVRSAPLFFIVLLPATWLCWTSIGRYGRITMTFILACVSQLPFLLLVPTPLMIGIVWSVLSGQRTDADSQGMAVSLLVWAYVPQVLCAVAAVLFVFIVLLGRKIGRTAGSAAPLVAFRRLVRARRQTYRKYRMARLPVLPLAFLGALVTIAVLSSVLVGALDTFLPVSIDIRTSKDAIVDYMQAHPLLSLTRMVLTILIILGNLAAVVWWARFAWRAIRRGANDVLADPRYRPVVFLRSFRDEDARVASKNPFWSLVRRRVRLEEVVAGQMMRLGPFVAIGVPGEWAPKLGAMRAYFADTDWQAAIRSWTDRSALSVVMAGESPSVLWELQHLIWSNRISTLLMVLPPDVSPQARARRRQAVSRAFAGTRWQQGIATADVGNDLCLTFEPDGTVVSVKGWPKHQIDYEVAVQTAVVRLLASRPAA
jgi:hypothetical protein